ncbi:MAG TPA: hypothetical protein VHZ75_01080 [Solirubrobacteraceae bacterium]|jgi:hypothetical protein|nr:hypothetical protein [Solirubrobacteraceae bacterium]
MGFWKRRDDLEGRLRGARPKPQHDLVRSLASQSRPARRGFLGNVGRVPFAAAGGLTAVVLVAVIALGGLSAPIGALGKAFDFQNLKARKADTHKVENSSTVDQYGTRTNVCVGGYIQLRLYQSEADHLVGGGLGVLGVCTGDTPSSGPARDTACLDGYLEVRLSDAEFSDLTTRHLVVAGACPRT